MRVWLDGNAADLNDPDFHANFSAAPTNGILLLSFVRSGATNVIDFLAYSNVVAGHSFGHVPDGSPHADRILVTPSPVASNNGELPQPPPRIYINEWMADNRTVLADPSNATVRPRCHRSKKSFIRLLAKPRLTIAWSFSATTVSGG